MADVLYRNVTQSGPLTLLTNQTSPLTLPNAAEDQFEVWVSRTGKLATAGAVPAGVPADPTAAPAQDSVTGTSITVTFGALADATDYDIQYSSDGGTTWTLVENIGASPVTIAGLTAATDYVVQYRGTNTAGDSAWSASSATITTAAAAFFADNFGRSNRALASDPEWVQATGMPGLLRIVNEEVQIDPNEGSNTSHCHASIVLTPDQFCEHKVVRNGSTFISQGVRTAVRCTATRNNGYWGQLLVASGGQCEWRLERYDGSAITAMASGFITDPGSTWTQRVEVVGNIIRFFIDGVNVSGDVDLSAHGTVYTSVLAGMGFIISATDSTWVRADNFSCGDL